MNKQIEKSITNFKIVSRIDLNLNVVFYHKIIYGLKKIT